MEIPATSDNIPGTLVLRDANGVVKAGNSGFIKEFDATASSSNRDVLVGRRTDAGGLFRITQQDGSGRLNITWNVEGNSVGSGTYSSSTSEPALRLLITTAGFLFYTAPANTAGNAITWTEVFRVNLDGAVGIATAAPTAKLHVSGDAIVSANTSTDALRITQEGSGNALVVEDSANPDSTPFAISATGSVGIGTTSPVAFLDITSGNGQFPSAIRIRNSSHATSKRAGIEFGDQPGNTWVAGTDSIGDGQNNFFLYGGAAPSNRVLVDNSGNVGIGLTDPQNYGKLAVSGSLFLSGETSLYNPFGAVDAANRANTYIAFGVGGSGNDWAYLREIGTGNKLELALDLHDDGSDVNAGQAFSIRHLASSLTPDGGAQTLFKVNHDGNVGIGTAIPTEKLEVNGTVKAAGFSADGIQIEGLSGRNYFRDSEAVGELRVGAAWGLPGIYSESGRCVVAGQGGVSIEPIGASNVGVGTSTPSSKAILEVSSTTRGFLPPRMTTTERDAITSPPAGLMLYNSTTNKLQVRTDTTWVDLH